MTDPNMYFLQEILVGLDEGGAEIVRRYNSVAVNDSISHRLGKQTGEVGGT